MTLISDLGLFRPLQRVNPRSFHDVISNTDSKIWILEFSKFKARGRFHDILRLDSSRPACCAFLMSFLFSPSTTNRFKICILLVHQLSLIETRKEVKKEEQTFNASVFAVVSWLMEQQQRARTQNIIINAALVISFQKKTRKKNKAQNFWALSWEGVLFILINNFACWMIVVAVESIFINDRLWREIFSRECLVSETGERNGLLGARKGNTWSCRFFNIYVWFVFVSKETNCSLRVIERDFALIDQGNFFFNLPELVQSVDPALKHSALVEDSGFVYSAVECD